MKKIILSLVVIAAITLSANAQTKRNVQDKTGKKTEESNSVDPHKNDRKIAHQEMIKRLDLTETQKQQLESLNKDFKTKMTDLKNDNSSTAEELKAKRKVLFTEKNQEFDALLTPEQKTKMHKFYKESHKNNKSNHAQRIEKLKSSLGISDEQAAKIKVDKENFRAKSQAIKNDQSLSTEQKKEQFKALRNEMKNNFKSNLTPDQLKKFEEMKSAKPVKTT